MLKIICQMVNVYVHIDKKRVVLFKIVRLHQYRTTCDWPKLLESRFGCGRNKLPMAPT